MFVQNDIVCKVCGHIDEDVLCPRGSREDGWKLSLPPCSACGGPTSVSFAHGLAPIYNAFTPRDLGGGVVVTSRSEESELTARILARHPGYAEVHYEPDSKAAQRQRADEARHMGWAERQRLGIGEEAVKEQSEISEGARATAAKDAVKHNLDPKVAGDAAAASIPSAADLVGVTR